MAGVFDEAYVEAVLTAVERIPPGQVASYGDLAELRRGSAARGWSAG